MTTHLRIAMVAPVATSVPPARSGSVETMTSLLTEGLVARGHQVTLFATGTSRTRATLHATFEQGYLEDSSMWPWELCELFNLTAAVEQARSFDVIHYQAEYYPMSVALSRLAAVPVLQTLHYAPGPTEVALWSRYADAPFVAISREQARLMTGLNVVGIVPHGIDVEAFTFRETAEDYLLFLGRFTEGKGVLEAIRVAQQSGIRLILAAAENEYYHAAVAPLVDGTHVIYAGEVDHARRVQLLGGARALLYPVQTAEPFGLVIAEAMACGTPVAALNRGAVGELVDNGTSGGVFESADDLLAGLPGVMALDRHCVHDAAVRKFSASRMVDGYVGVYERVTK